MSANRVLDFEHGDCAALAVVLHRLTGYPLMAVLDFDPDVQKEVLVHAFVQTPHTDYPAFDICGPTSVDDIMEKFPIFDDDAEAVPITVERVLEINYAVNCPDQDLVKTAAEELLEKWKFWFAAGVTCFEDLGESDADLFCELQGVSPGEESTEPIPSHQNLLRHTT